MSAEAFTILAILEARDQASEIFAKIDESLDKFSETAKSAADTARGAGDSIDDSLLKTASGADALDLATARVEAAQAKAAESAKALAEAETALLDAQRDAAGAADGAAASTDGLIAADARLAGAQKDAAAAAKALSDAQKAQSDVAVAAAAKNDEAAAGTTAVSDASKESGLNLGKFGLIAGAALAGVGYESTKLAISFQSAMSLLNTQAGVAKSALPGLQQGVLSLAGKVGFSPDSLAGALYHVESSFASVGIKGPQALNLLKIAAQGATVGHANLTDVTNALDATIVAGVPGITSYSGAMGALNAIVGSGDMSMQQLADAMGTGVMAVAKSFGQNINQVGAALAVFGDNNIRGAAAATELRMTWEAMQQPLTTAGPLLSSLGLGMHTLSQTMTHQGLSAAISEFTQHLKASKVPASDWGAYMTQIFGKRAGVGLGVLTDQLSRLKSKFPDLTAGAKGFGAAAAAAYATPAEKLKLLAAGTEAAGTSLGLVLLPALESLLGPLTKFMGYISGSKVRMDVFAGVVGVLAGTVLVAKLGGAIKGSVEDFRHLAGTVQAAAVKLGLLKKASADSGAASEKASAGSAAAAEKSAGEQEAAADEAAATQEADAGEVAAANDEAAAESSGSWLAAAGQQIASAAGWVADQAVKVAAVVASNVGAAATTAGAWLASAASGVAGAAMWVAGAIAKVAVVVASNVAGAAVTMAAWIAANAVMLLGIGLIVVAVAAAVYLIVSHWHQIVDGVKKAWNAVYDFISKIISDVISFVKSHWMLIVAIFLGPLAIAALEIYKHFDQIKKFVSKAVTDVIDFVKSHWRLIISILGGPLGIAVALVTKYWSDIKHWFTEGVSDVLGIFRRLPGQMLSIGTDVVRGIWSGISGAAGWLAGKVEGFASSVLSSIGSAFGIGSPSRHTFVHGQMLGQGLANGMIASIPAAVAAAHRMSGAVLTALSPAHGGGLAAGSSGLGLSALGQGGAAGSGGVVVNLTINDPHMMSDADMTKFVNKLGPVLTRTLGQAGVKVRMG